MIEINLLPEGLRPRKAKMSLFRESTLARFRVPDIEPKHLVTWLLVAIVAVQAILSALQLFERSRLTALNARYAELAPRKKEADDIKGLIKSIQKKSRAIKGSLKRQFMWAEKLNALSDSVIPGIWLTSLSYDERIAERSVAPGGAKVKVQDDSKVAGRPQVEKYVARYLVLTGCAHSATEDRTAYISKFIKSLKENSMFYQGLASIAVEDIKEERFDGEEIMTFKITCTFEEQV